MLSPRGLGVFALASGVAGEWLMGVDPGAQSLIAGWERPV